MNNHLFIKMDGFFFLILIFYEIIFYNFFFFFLFGQPKRSAPQGETSPVEKKKSGKIRDFVEIYGFSFKKINLLLCFGLLFYR